MTQKQQIITLLERDGCVSRNQALSMYISRLGAITCDLRASGWQLKGEWRGNDYFYVLESKPPVPPRVQLSHLMEERLRVYD